MRPSAKIREGSQFFYIILTSHLTLCNIFCSSVCDHIISIVKKVKTFFTAEMSGCQYVRETGGYTFKLTLRHQLHPPIIGTTKICIVASHFVYCSKSQLIYHYERKDSIH